MLDPSAMHGLSTLFRGQVPAENMDSQYSSGTRRKFLRRAAALPFLWYLDGRLAHSVPQPSVGQPLLPDLWVLNGAVNSALVERNGRKLLIDSGEIDSAPGG